SSSLVIVNAHPRGGSAASGWSAACASPGTPGPAQRTAGRGVDDMPGLQGEGVRPAVTIRVPAGRLPRMRLVPDGLVLPRLTGPVARALAPTEAPDQHRQHGDD